MTREMVLAVALVSSACAHTATVTPVAAVSGRPTFALTATRRMAFTGVPILLTAQLVGGAETEAFYCPRVVWEWADGTRSVTESDCEPFAPGVEYPRRWTRWVALAVPGAEYPVVVRWEKAGRLLGRADIVLTALGGE